MNWAVLHAESERLAIDAYLKLRAQNIAAANVLYSQAAEAEQRALRCLDVSKLRTRGITAVSAVALWFKATEYARAEQLAHEMLADARMPDFAREDLRNLVQAIWTESAKQTAGVTFIPGQVLVSVRGGEVVTGGAPLDLIVEKVQTIQAMFYRTIEYLNGTVHRKGPPPRELQEACRPWLFQSAPGSYQFSVAIQKPKQLDFFKQEIEPDRIAEHFLEIVRTSSSEDDSELKTLVSDEAYRTTFLKLARNLAPTGKKSFEGIELRASGEPRPISLDVESRAKINNQLRKKSLAVIGDPPTEEVLLGTLRAVHLDQDWLDITVDDKSLHVNGLKDTVDDVIGPMVNRSVSVWIIRLPSNKLKFVDIELAD